MDESNLGACPACQTALVRSRHDHPRYRTVKVTAAQPPPKAYYPEVSFLLRVVWCPACGWIARMEAPQLGMSWINREYESPRD